MSFNGFEFTLFFNYGFKIINSKISCTRREMLCSQHFHNTFIINPKWQVVTGCY